MESIIEETDFLLQVTKKMALQHLLIQLPNAKKPIWILSEVAKCWLEYDGAMCLRHIDGNQLQPLSVFVLMMSQIWSRL